METSIFSWNILGPATGDVEDYGFIKNDYGRLGQHLKIIDRYKADILCFQEIDLTALHLFNNFLLSEYDQLSYHEKGAHGGVVIYAKKSKFELISSVGSLLQRENKKSPGSFAGVFIRDIVSKEELFIASVHLSKSSHPQEVFDANFQMKNLCDQLGKNLPQKSIFAGDYNTLYEDMKSIVVPEMSKVLDKNLLMFEHEICTSYSPSGELSSIDHILYSGFKIDLKKSCVIDSLYRHIDADTLEKISEHGYGYVVSSELPSDHLPIVAFLK